MPCITYLYKFLLVWNLVDFFLFFLSLQRPPSSSLSYGPGNDDVRSPGSGGTPGPLSQPPGSQQSVDTSDPGKEKHFFIRLFLI